MFYLSLKHFIRKHNWQLSICCARIIFSKRLAAENRDQLEVQKYAINTPFWQVPPALLTSKQHLPVTKADVLSYFRKKPAIKTAGGTCQDDVLMATMRCARRHARGHELQRCRHRVRLLVHLYSKLAGSTQSKQLRIELLYRYKPAKTSRITMFNMQRLYLYFLYFKLYVTLSGARQSPLLWGNPFGYWDIFG